MKLFNKSIITTCLIVLMLLFCLKENVLAHVCAPLENVLGPSTVIGGRLISYSVPSCGCWGRCTFSVRHAGGGSVKATCDDTFDGIPCELGDTWNYCLEPATFDENGNLCKCGICSNPSQDQDEDGHNSDVDCDDDNPNIYPGATELCDDIDNNCNGQVDEGFATIAENCDGIDNNCNKEIDEGLACVGGSCTSTNTGSSANYMSGNLFHDLALQSGFTLFYNSLDDYSDILGRGWTHNYNASVTESPSGSLLLMEEDGSRTYFSDDGTGTYRPDAQTGDVSTINVNGVYFLTKKDGTSYTFDLDAGKLLEITDSNNNITSLTYTYGNLVSIIDPVGRVTDLEYDANSKIISVTDPLGRVTLIEYDANGNLASTTDPQGNSWVYTYDAENKMLTKTDPNNNNVTYEYDSEGKLITSTNEYGTKSIDYDQANNSATITERDGGVWTYTYDLSLSVPLQVTDPAGQVTTYTYDENRNRVSETDSLGNTTSYTYDDQGNMLSVTDTEGNTTSYTYNEFGQTTGITDQAGDTTLFDYDESGNLVSTTDAAGSITAYEYDDFGNITKLTDATGKATTFTYNEFRNLISVTDPAGATTTFTYDEIGNMISQTDSAGNTTLFEYNALNQLISVTDADGNVTVYTYDSRGNKTSETDANGNATFYEYDQNNNIVQVTDALENITSYSYDSTGSCPVCGGSAGGGNNITSITDAKNRSTVFHYDYLGRLTGETNPLDLSTHYSYDAKGNLVSKTDSNNNIVTYSYNSLGRLIQKTYPDASTETFTYDVKGNIITASNANISYAFTYDVNKRVTSVTDSNERTVSYEYDVSGRTFMTTPEGDNVTYEYDASNRLGQISSFAGSFDFAYDSLGRRASLTYPNGIVTNYNYNAVSQLISIINPQSKIKDLKSFTYSYDNVGNRLSKSITGKKKAKNTDYRYDEIYRLLSASMTHAPGPKTHKRGKHAEVYNYDDVGNRLTGPKEENNYSYNNGNRLQSDSKHQYSYDSNGNLISRLELDDYEFWTYEYDFENRLIKVVKNEEDEIKTVSFKYDPFGRRIEKKVEEIENGEVEETKTYTYLYDNEDIILEYLTKEGEKGSEEKEDKEGEKTEGRRLKKTEVTKYVHGSGIDEPLAIERKGKTYYYHADGLGSITALTDKKQKVVESYEYDSFGKMKRKGGKVKNTFTYTGREWDKETELYYYRARYYDADVGRFISEDPIGFRGGVNLYAYVFNNPVNWVDPWGLFSWDDFAQSFGKGFSDELANSAWEKGSPGSLAPIAAGLAEALASGLDWPYRPDYSKPWRPWPVEYYLEPWLEDRKKKKEKKYCTVR